MIRSAVVVVISLLSSAAFSQQDAYVSPVGNDSNDCYSPSTPCLTVQRAVYQVHIDGGVIFVEPGWYPDPINDFSGTNVSLNGMGLGPGDVILAGLAVGNAIGAYITNLTVEGGITVNESRDVTFENLVIQNGFVGIDIGDSPEIHLVAPINILNVQNCGICLRGLSTLTYNGHNSAGGLTIVGITTSEGTGILLDMTEMVANGPIDISNFQTGISAELSRISLTGDSSPIHDNRSGANLRESTARFSNLVFENNQFEAIWARAGNLSLKGVQVSNNALNNRRALTLVNGNSTTIEFSQIQNNGEGILAASGSDLRLTGTTIQNNGDHGVRLNRFSAAFFTPAVSTISGHSVADLFCEDGLAGGDLSQVGTIDCDDNSGTVPPHEHDLEDHTHTYLTGKGNGQNNTEVQTGPAE